MADVAKVVGVSQTTVSLVLSGRGRDLRISEEMQRLVARLHLIEEMEHGEIAAVTGLSDGTVRSHLSLARSKVKEKLADLYD